MLAFSVPRNSFPPDCPGPFSPGPSADGASLGRPCSSSPGFWDTFPQTGGLTQRERVLSPFRRLGGRGDGSSMLGSFRGCEGESAPGLPASFWRCWQSVVSLGLQMHHCDLCPHLPATFALSMCLWPNFPFVKGHQSYRFRGPPFFSIISF